MINKMKGFLAIGLAGLIFLVLLAGLVFFGTGYYLSPQSKLKPSDVLVAVSGGETDSRVEEAVSLYREGWAKQVIFAGAALDPASPSNALVMKRQAIKMGVPAGAITIEERSTNTQQNAQFVAKIVKSRGYDSLILVTSPYHQRRAYITFKRAMPNTEIFNHSAKDHTWRRSRWWSNPRGVWLTLAELQKTLFLILGGQP